MPIKQLKFSFTVGVQELAQIISQGHNEMNIEVVEDAPRVQSKLKSAIEDVLALPPPKPNGRGHGRTGMKVAILTALRGGGKRSVAELRTLVVAQGYSAKSLSNQIHQLHKEEHLIKRAGRAHYTLTKKGQAK
jgi:predicted transcriptional regulator